MYCVSIPSPDGGKPTTLTGFESIKEARAAAPKVSGVKAGKTDVPFEDWTYRDGCWQSGARKVRD